MWLHIEAFTFMLFARDTKWTVGSRTARADDTFQDSVDLIFIRHGESTWNDTFNRTKFPPLFAKRLLWSALFEITLMFSGANDSWFYDSPLSEFGLTQAEELKTYLAKNKDDDDVALLLDLDPERKSTVVASNLRRAISTAMVGLWDRINRPSEKLLLQSSLQEISRNVDTMAMTRAGTHPTPSWVDTNHRSTPYAMAMSQKIDPSLNFGNKDLHGTGQQRFFKFSDWAFEEDRGTLICVGHSLYFQKFFREFLPQSVEHDCKKRKMVNCGVVKCTLRRAIDNSGEAKFSVDPESIKVIYGGFKK